MRLLFILCGSLVPSIVFPQSLSLGIALGSSPTNDFRSIQFPATFYGTTNAVSGSPSLIAGPTVEVGFRADLSVEVNALHRALRFTDFALRPDGAKNNQVGFAVTTWEFPVLAKYRFGAGIGRPFVELGASFRAVGNPSGSSPSNHGVTVGVGTTLHLGAIHVAPVVRYTHWATDRFRPEQTGGFNSPARPTVSDQVELLMNVSGSSTEGSRRPLGHKLWIGLLAGAGLTGDFRKGSSTGYSVLYGAPTPTSVDRSGARSYPAGLSLEWELTSRLAVKSDGIYRRLHFSGLHDVVLTWEVPVLLQYGFTGHAIIPYVAAGPSFRVAGNLNGANPSHFGWTGEAGALRRFRHVRIGPALRFTHWNADTTPTPAFPANPFPRTVPNQLEMLVGFSF